jgi:hypothetical protein
MGVNAQEFGGFWLGSIGGSRCGGGGCIFDIEARSVEFLALRYRRRLSGAQKIGRSTPTVRKVEARDDVAGQIEGESLRAACRPRAVPAGRGKLFRISYRAMRRAPLLALW